MSSLNKPRINPAPMAAIVQAPCGAEIGPRTGYPSQTQRIIVLESDRRECKPKNRPAKPKPANSDDPSLRPWIARSFPLAGDFRVERRTAKTARIRPVAFQPPFEA